MRNTVCAEAARLHDLDGGRLGEGEVTRTMHVPGLVAKLSPRGERFGVVNNSEVIFTVNSSLRRTICANAPERMEVRL